MMYCHQLEWVCAKATTADVQWLSVILPLLTVFARWSTRMKDTSSSQKLEAQHHIGKNYAWPLCHGKAVWHPNMVWQFFSSRSPLARNCESHPETRGEGHSWGLGLVRALQNHQYQPCHCCSHVQQTHQPSAQRFVDVRCWACWIHNRLFPEDWVSAARVASYSHFALGKRCTSPRHLQWCWAYPV